MVKAIRFLASTSGNVRMMSPIYFTQAWGPVKQADYLNMAIGVDTILPPNLFLRRLLDIEKRFGRRRELKYGPRTLDMDILFYGRKIIRSKDLKVPHPELHNRRFALVPLMDLAPDFKHPVLGKTIRRLLGECPDTLEVKGWK